MPSRPVTRTLRSPRSEDRTAENPGTAAARSPATFRSAPLESHPDRPGDSPPRLDLVDRAGFCLVEYLERRPPGKAIDRVERIGALADAALAISSGQDLRLTLKLILERLTGMHGVDPADLRL